VITYEDPPLLFRGELDDITAEVARDRSAPLVRSGKGIWVPRNKALAWTEHTTSETPSIDQVQAALHDLLRIHNASDAGGKLKLVREGDVLHVVPARTKLQNGQWWDVFSVMDVPLTIAPGLRNVDEQLDAIFDAIGKKLGVSIGITRRPVNAMQVPPSMYQLDGVTGRQQVADILKLINVPTRWSILYDPSTQSYNVLFMRLPDRTPLDAGAAELAAPERTTTGPSPSSRLPPPQ
jgi:hypothetical protein